MPQIEVKPWGIMSETVTWLYGEDQGTIRVIWHRQAGEVEFDVILGDDSIYEAIRRELRKRMDEQRAP